METYLGNSQENSLDIINYKKSNLNSDEKDLDSKSDVEVDITSLKKVESKKENNTQKENILFNIDTLQSLRISYSLEKSKNCQSLIDIINKGNYNFEENNENDMNTINKINNNNEQDSFNTNKGVLNSNYKNKNSFISNESNIKHSNKKIDLNINTNNNDTSAVTKNSNVNNKNIEVKSKVNFTSFSLGNKNKEKFKDIYSNYSNNYNNNNISSFKFNIEEMFKEKFEERTKPKNKNSDISAKTSKIKKNNSNAEKNEGKVKPKTLEHKNEKYLINFDSNYLNNTNNDSIIEKKEKATDYIENFDNNIKKKELCFLNIDNNNQFSKENIDDIDEDIDYVNKTNNIIEDEKSNELIVGMFGGKPDSSLEEDSNSKNVVISELDINISNSIKNNNLNKKKLSNDEIKMNNINLEKAIEENLIKGNFNTNNFESIKLKDISKEINDKNLYNNNYNYNNKQKISSRNTNKKPNFNKKIHKKIYPIKKINSYSNIKNIKANKNEEKINYFENYINKEYRYNPLTVKLVESNKYNNMNYINKNNHEIKNISSNSGSHGSSFIVLNTSTNHNNNKTNIIYKKMTYTSERPCRINSNRKEKKTKNAYNNIIYNKLYRKINNNNILTKDIKNLFLNRNNNKILNTLYTTAYSSNNQNNISSKEPFINKPYIISADAKKRNKKNNSFLKNNTTINTYLKNNKKKFFDFPQNFSISSSRNNNYDIKVLNNSIHSNINNNKNNLYNYEKRYKNKKKNDIPICNINRNKIPFKRKITSLKKNELYSNNEKIRNKINSVNNIINRTSSYQNNNRKNILNIGNDTFSKYKYGNLFSNFIDNKYDTNTICNSYTNNVNINSNKTYLSNNERGLNNSKNINNIDNSSLLINNNTNSNFKNSFLPKKTEKRLVLNKNNNTLAKENKDNINLITEITNIAKNYPYLNRILKNIINSKSKNNKNKKRLIYDKIISKNYIRNISQKNDSFNIKINNSLLPINNNDSKFLNKKTKIVNSYRNNNQNITDEEPKHIPAILDKYKISKKL